MYLAVVTNLYSRHIIGWSFQDHLRTELAIGALSKALTKRKPRPDCCITRIEVFNTPASNTNNSSPLIRLFQA